MAVLEAKRSLIRTLFLIVFVYVPSTLSYPAEREILSLSELFAQLKGIWLEKQCVFPSKSAFLQPHQELGVLNSVSITDFPLKACSENVENEMSNKWELCNSFFEISTLFCNDSVTETEKLYLNSTFLEESIKQSSTQELCTEVMEQNINSFAWMNQSCNICDDKELQPVCNMLFAAVLNYLKAVKLEASVSSERAGSNSNVKTVTDQGAPGHDSSATQTRGSTTRPGTTPQAVSSPVDGAGIPTVEGGNLPGGNTNIPAGEGGNLPVGDSSPAGEGGNLPVGDIPAGGGNLPVGDIPAGEGGNLPVGDSSPAGEGGNLPVGDIPAGEGGNLPVGDSSPAGEGGNLPVGDIPAGEGGNLPVGDIPAGEGGNLPVGDIPAGEGGNLPGGGSSPAGEGGNLPVGDIPAGEGGNLPVGDIPAGEGGNLPVGDIPAGEGGNLPGGGSPTVGGNLPGGGSPAGEGGNLPGGGSPTVGGNLPGGGSPAVGGNFPGGGSPAVGGNLPGGGSPTVGGNLPGGGSPTVGGNLPGGGSPAVGGNLPGGGSPTVGGNLPGGGSPAVGGNLPGGGSPTGNLGYGNPVVGQPFFQTASTTLPLLEEIDEEDQEGSFEIGEHQQPTELQEQWQNGDGQQKPPAQNPPAVPEDGVQSFKNVVEYNFKEEESPSGHFMAYFITAIVLCVAGYVIYHNKQKIFAIALEGRRDSQRRRPSAGTDSSAKYSKLQSTVEEVVPALEKSTTSKNYIY